MTSPGNSRTRSKRFVQFSAFLLGLVLVCIAASYFTSRFFVRPDSWTAHDQPHGHQWLHQELDLTEAEAVAMDAFEGDYRQAREELRGAFEQEIAELRTLLMAKDEFTPEVEHAIHDLHGIHGRLQELSIRHYFQMLEVLPAEKREKLRELAGEALSVPE